MENMSWAQFLLWLQTPGSIQIVVGALIYLAGDYIPGFIQAIEEPKRKRLAVAGISLVIAEGAYLLNVLTVTHGPLTLDGVWTAFMAAGLSFGVATLAHTRDLVKTEPVANPPGG